MILVALASLALGQNFANIYQVSAFEALRVGRYDGVYPVADLPKHGDFGVGTFNGLNGEMVVLDGKVYQINGFGDVAQPAAGTLTPFAFVTHFRGANITFPRRGEPMSRMGLESIVDRAVGNPNAIVAIRIDGSFQVDARSFAPQQKPYLPFAKIGDRQSMFHYERVSGTFVGFRMPKSVGTLNVPGYHFHFLTTDRKHGGHVLGYTAIPTRIQVMRIGQIRSVPVATRGIYPRR